MIHKFNLKEKNDKTYEEYDWHCILSEKTFVTVLGFVMAVSSIISSYKADRSRSISKHFIAVLNAQI